MLSIGMNMPQTSALPARQFRWSEAVTNMTKLQVSTEERPEPAAFSKIVEALQNGNSAEAAIRFAQWRQHEYFAMNTLKRVFDPSQPRDDKGRWTDGNASRAFPA